MNDINSLFYCTPLWRNVSGFPARQILLKTSAIELAFRTPQGNAQNDRASPHRPAPVVARLPVPRVFVLFQVFGNQLRPLIAPFCLLREELTH